jgi:hypothetical protein
MTNSLEINDYYYNKKSASQDEGRKWKSLSE